MGRTSIRNTAWWSRRALVLIAALAAISWSSLARAAPTVLDFEDLTAPATVTAQYGPLGVLFHNAYLDTDAAAHSGTRVLRSVPPNSEIFTAFPFVITFTAPQTRVRLFAGWAFAPVDGTLTAFDANGAVVAVDGPNPIEVDAFTAEFEVVAPSASIMRVELQFQDTAYAAIDDLEFEGDPPAPTSDEPPIVELTSPIDGAELDVSTIDIAGTATGEGLLSPAHLTIEWGRPPESTAPPFGSDVALLGTGTTRDFSLPGFAGVPLGPITVTAAVENTGAKTGTGSITFTNLPAAIRTRYAGEGGAAALGGFRFGVLLDGCKVAVYDQAAISVDGAGVTWLIRGAILTKWLSLRGPADETGWFGCPLEEARGRPGAGSSHLQGFQKGRIYTDLPNGLTVYVPEVVVDATDRRGGAGVPLADPLGPSELTPSTFLFQKFMRPDRPDLMDSTVEIRGTPPMIWVERQSGDLQTETSATLFDGFPCTDSDGPCSVDTTPSGFTSIQDAGDVFCGGTTWPWAAEWNAVLNDYASTPIFGVITSSHMSARDNPFVHQYAYEPCPHEVDCPSDWNIDIRTIGPHRGVAPYGSLFAGDQDEVEIEYEALYAQAPHIFLDWPQVGDLFFGAGRWIIDCGHDNPYNAELHPLFMFAKMKTEKFEGHVATRADLWVNGWYPGEPIEFDIFPPPRPSPSASLVVNKPVDADAALDVNVEYTVVPAGAANHVHVKFSAPIRHNTITGDGEMLWEVLRGYWGQWFLYWNQ